MCSILDVRSDLRSSSVSAMTTSSARSSAVSWTPPSCCGPTTWSAFLDHRPVFKGHVLLAPVRHIDTLLDLPAELMTPLLTAAQRVAAALGDGAGRARARSWR